MFSYIEYSYVLLLKQVVLYISRLFLCGCLFYCQEVRKHVSLLANLEAAQQYIGAFAPPYAPAH